MHKVDGRDIVRLLTVLLEDKAALRRAMRKVRSGRRGRPPVDLTPQLLEMARLVRQGTPAWTAAGEIAARHPGPRMTESRQRQLYRQFSKRRPELLNRFAMDELARAHEAAQGAIIEIARQLKPMAEATQIAMGKLARQLEPMAEAIKVSGNTWNGPLFRWGTDKNPLNRQI